MNKNKSLASILTPTVAVVLVLAAGICWQLAFGPPPSRADPTPPTVTLSGERILHASAATADFDGDGDKEIVIGGTDGMLYVIAYNGSSWSVVWSRQTADDLNAAGAPATCETTAESDIRSAAAIADLDNDGHLEIVVTTGGNPGNHFNGAVLVYTFNSAWFFSVVPAWPEPRIDEVGAGSGIRDPDGCWDGISAAAALGDLDGDGDLEIVTQSLNRRIYAWHHDATPVSGWPIWRYSGDNLLRGGESTPALGDIDGDGLPEVVIGTNGPPWDGHSPPDYSKGSVWAINGDSSNVPGWPVETENKVRSSAAIGDIDRDGQLEVVVGSAKTAEGSNGRRVYAWHSDGSAVSGWPKSTAGDMTASPALGDLDGDGDLEIVIGCGIESDPTGCTLLYAWHHDGNSVSGFPLSPPANDPDSSDPSSLPYSPVLADYDGDGAVEILVAVRLKAGLATVESDGTPNNDPAFQTQRLIGSPPLVDDVDDDGKLEVVIVGANTGGVNGAVYILDVNGDAEPGLPWPMFHHDVYRTGNITFYLDETPPHNPTTVDSATHTPGVWSNEDTVQMNWSGAYDDESGIAGYYYVWDQAATTDVDESASWIDGSLDALSSELDDGASWYFHIRAVNHAHLLAEDTVHFGPLQIDTTPPASQANAPACAVGSATVSWGGTDAGSGLASYTVQVRQEGAGSWTDWLAGTTATGGVYTDSSGYVYQFRSIAHDLAGNVEVKSTYDAQTWLTQYGFSGMVYNTQAQPVFLAQVTSDPAVPLTVKTTMQGDYLLCHEEALTYALSASRPDFGPLPAMQDLAGTIPGLDFYLPPTEEALTNGQFETGDLSGWESVIGGNGASAITDTAHTGDYGVELSDDGSPAAAAALNQSVVIPGTLQDPTLSVLYRTSGDDAAWVAVQGSAQTVSQALSTPATAWSHAWLDLSALQGQAVTVVVGLDNPPGGSGWLVVDEVSLGPAVPGVRKVYLPLVLRQ